MAAPELRLNVSLDLGFFRQQLRQLSTVASSEFNAPLKVKFDKTSLNNELRLLTNQLSRRKYAIQINDTSIKTARVNAQKLKNTLDLLTKQKYIVNVEYQQKGGPAGTGGGTQRSAGFASARQQVSNLTAEQLRNRAFQSLGKESRSAQQVSQWLDTVLQQGLKGGAKKKQLDAIRDYLADALASSARGGVEARMRGQGFGGAGKVQRSALDQIARAVFFMAGIDPAKVRAERRRIPSIDWQATAPSRGRSTGPSSTGRMLPPGYTPPGLPGTAIGSQRLLIGDILDPSLKNAAREAANSFVDTIRKGLNEAVRAVNVRDLGNALRPALTGSRVAGFLAPGVGRVSSPYGTGRLGRDGETRAELFARREREARMRSALRGVDVMGEGGVAGRPPSSYGYAYRGARPQSAIVPYAAGGAMVYSGPGGGGGGTGGGPGNFAGRGGGAGGGFNMPNLPGAGLVREIGQEFAFATKQVLLFGTAYKALAFATNFPAQVGQAVAALQSFNNTLKAISPSAKEVQASNNLILQLVDKYNIPLQSARDGFTKLYASMQSAGFGGDEVRDIFTGISKAAATFGMSADKVDRVNYAFAQMASKGQVMSEELKGQLGDVLPGALGIFAEAAGFKGPDAIQKFSKALEAGAYKGQAMKQLLTNVGVVMNKEFGPGAEGAARTFQGAMNRMQNSLLFLYEAFEPAAVQFLNAVVMPLTGGIKQLTDGFNAFFTGQAAQTTGGGAIAQQLNALKPSFEGILQNLKELIPTFQLLGNIVLGVSKVFIAIAGNPIAGFLLKVYANVLLVNGVFTLLGGRILVGLIASINAAIARFIALNLSVATLQRTSAVTTSTLAGTQVQMALLARGAGAAVGPVSLLRGALLGIARLGAIAVSISVAIYGLEALMEARRQIDAIRGLRSKGGTAATLIGASRETILNSKTVAQKTLGQAQKELKDLKVMRAAMPAGLGSLMGTRQATLEQRILDAQGVLGLKVPGVKPSLPAASTMTGGGMPIGAEAGGGKEKGAKGRESQVAQLALELEYAKELSALEAQIFNAQLGENNLLAVRLEGEKELLDLRYEKLKVNLEDIPPEEKLLKIQTISQKADLARLKTRSAMEAEITKAINEQQRAVENLQAASQLELDNKKQYQELLKNGIAPEQAKILIEVDNEIKKIKDALELTRKRVKAEIDVLEALKAQGKAIDEALLNKLKGQYGEAGEGIEALPGIATEETAKRFALNVPKTATEYVAEGLDQARKNLAELMNIGNQVVGAANAIGEAFGEAFKGVASGSMTAQQALASFFQNVGDYFLDMAARMIAEWLKMQLIQGLTSFIGGIFGGGGFGGGALGSSSANVAQYAPLPGTGYANGGIAMGGFTAFANGGMVTGPTMGLVGEGRYNEAIVPLPNGKSIPVELGGAAGNQMNTNITVNVNNGQAQSNATGSNSSELGRKIEGAVKQVIVGELRPGGLLASR